MKDGWFEQTFLSSDKNGKGSCCWTESFFLAESLWKNSHASFNFKYTQDAMIIVLGKMEKRVTTL